MVPSSSANNNSPSALSQSHTLTALNKDPLLPFITLSLLNIILFQNTQNTQPTTRRTLPPSPPKLEPDTNQTPTAASPKVPKVPKPQPSPKTQPTPMLTTTPRDTSRRDSNGHTPLSRQNHAKAKVQILEKWFVDHLEYPYPTEEEKEELLDIAQMNRRQLDNWFINARRPERKEKFIARANAHKVPSPSSQPRKHSWESIPLESPPPSKRQKSIKPEDTTNIRPSSPIKLDADPAIKVDLNSTPTLIESVSIIKPNEDGAIPPPPLKKMKAHHYKEPRIIQMEVYPPINSASSIFATAPKAATAVSR